MCVCVCVCVCRCSAAALTTGTCLPGFHILQYTVRDSQGNGASANLTVYVEQLSRTQVIYSFVSPNVTNATLATDYARNLTTNGTLFLSVIGQQHLPQVSKVLYTARMNSNINNSLHTRASLGATYAGYSLHVCPPMSLCVCVCVSIGLTEHTDRGAPVCVCVCVCVCVNECSLVSGPRTSPLSGPPG